jgi:hypothetical protein
MKYLITIVCWLWMPWAMAQPVLGENLAAALIDKGLQAQPLIWLPFPLPYEVEQGSRSKDALLLDALYRNELIEREKVMKMGAVAEQGQTRKKVLLLWSYNYPMSRREQNTPEGFYYGRGRLKSIMELSPPYLIGEYYYAEAYIEWYVEDIQPWIEDPAFGSARTLRRTLESERKPFEKRVYLQYDGQQWALWQGDPGML